MRNPVGVLLVDLGKGRRGASYVWLDPAKDAIPIAHSPFSVIDFLQAGINCFSRLRPWCGARKCGCAPQLPKSAVQIVQQYLLNREL